MEVHYACHQVTNKSRHAGTPQEGRLLECGIEDVFYARSISRIRQLYRELDPSRAHYFHEVGVDQGGPPTPELVTLRVQQFLPASAMVAIVNSVVGGVFIAAAAAYLLTPPTWVAAIR
ncbi:MAG TPA: hypothetical protein VN965_04510 [Candidatus Dormibacteraeota bacterium]|nr:hypothetical protein [Candidatus Dormibacteraeota bacterium]